MVCIACDLLLVWLVLKSLQSPPWSQISVSLWQCCMLAYQTERQFLWLWRPSPLKPGCMVICQNWHIVPIWHYVTSMSHLNDTVSSPSSVLKLCSPCWQHSLYQLYIFCIFNYAVLLNKTLSAYTINHSFILDYFITFMTKTKSEWTSSSWAEKTLFIITISCAS